MQTKIDKKFTAFWLLAFASCFLVSCASHHKAKPRTGVPHYYSWHTENRSYQEHIKQTTINIVYPEISSTPSSAFAQTINQEIRAFVDAQVGAFRAKVHPDNIHVKDFGIQMRQNILKIETNTYLVKDRQDEMFSVRFHVYKTFSGKDIPDQSFAVLNYDLTQQTSLSLDSLFIPDSPYLKIISNYCTEKLPEKLELGMPWLPENSSGLLPKPENYKIWNLRQDGVLITFQIYQVTPYSPRAQTILVPFSELRTVVSPESPIWG